MDTLMSWWQMFILILSPMVMALIAVVVGGWLVFKTKTITMPTPFMSGVKKDKGSYSYAPDFGNDDPGDSGSIFDETLSSAAARLRAQKKNNDNLKIIRGKS